MARYIDAEALYEKLYPLDLVDKRLYAINAKAVADAIAKTPTADVAPRAEVAAEIFAEIKRTLGEEYTELVERRSRIKDPDALDGIDGELSGLDWAMQLIEELEKKYSEGNS